MYIVSIPQAVSTIAIALEKAPSTLKPLSFNTASGKYYCNSRPYKASIHGGLKIGFGKPHTVNGQNALPFDPQGLWI